MNKHLSDTNNNIGRIDRGQSMMDKYTDLYNIFQQWNNSSLTNTLASNFISSNHDILVSPSFQEEKIKDNIIHNQSSSKILNSPIEEINSCKSDVNSYSKELKHYINFNSVPTYGISEKATQTLITGRELDDLEHIKNELKNNREKFIFNMVKGNPEVAKHMLIYVKKIEEDKKIHNITNLVSDSTDDFEKMPSRNFINIKRKSDNILIPTESFRTKKRNNSIYLPHSDKETHIHIKTGPRKKIIGVDENEKTQIEDHYDHPIKKKCGKKPAIAKNTKINQNNFNISNSNTNELWLNNNNSNQIDGYKLCSTVMNRNDINDLNISDIINNIKNTIKQEESHVIKIEKKVIIFILLIGKNKYY